MMCKRNFIYSSSSYFASLYYAIFILKSSHHVIQHVKNMSSSSQMSQTASRCVTWAEGLQEPGASRSAWCAGFRLGGVEGPNGLDIGLVVTCGGDLQHRDDCTLVQQAIRRHHFGVALLTATHSRLTRRGGTQEFNTMTWRKLVLPPCHRLYMSVL